GIEAFRRHDVIGQAHRGDGDLREQAEDQHADSARVAEPVDALFQRLPRAVLEMEYFAQRWAFLDRHAPADQHDANAFEDLHRLVELAVHEVLQHGHDGQHDRGENDQFHDDDRNRQHEDAHCKADHYRHSNAPVDVTTPSTIWQFPRRNHCLDNRFYPHDRLALQF